MTKPETPKPFTPLSDLAAALVLLSRLPVPASGPVGAGAVWAYPLAGAVLGALAALLAWAAMTLGLPPVLAAGLVLVALVVMTGAMHEDGLADVADGFWGGWTRERRLEIMKDSRMGAYGTIALVLSLGLRWQALALVLAQGTSGPLIATAALSRAAMPAVMAALPHARDTGLSHSVGRASPARALAAALIGAAIALACLPPLQALAGLLVAALATLALAALARRKIAGQTGDVLGATQQVAEIAILLVLAA